MIECLIVGDSIATGVATARPECVSVAEVGITSTKWNKKYLSQLAPSNTLIISLGANDFGTATEVNVRKLRIKADSFRVYWLLPSEKLKPEQVKAVKQVAKEFGDIVVARPESMISPDGVHPTGAGYQDLANKTKGN